MVAMQAQMIAQSGMAAATLRLDAAASNLANSQSDGVLLPNDGSAVDSNAPSVYDPRRIDQVSLSPSASKVAGVDAQIRAEPDFFASYKPDAAFANGQGMVASPNVDPVTEAVQMITAEQSFLSNMSVYKTADAMTKMVLDIKA
ncbi:MAG: flagellar basal-body rod protein [Pseudomonadota bacterium]